MWNRVPSWSSQVQKTYHLKEYRSQYRFESRSQHRKGGDQKNKPYKPKVFARLTANVLVALQLVLQVETVPYRMAKS
jgi:hypothetical protein